MFLEIKAYLIHINFANNCLDAYMSLFKNMQINNDILNKAPGFFLISKYALSKCVILEYAKLFCGSGDQKTINKLLNNVKAHANIFPKGEAMKIFNRFDAYLHNDLKEIIDCLTVRRNKDLAHNDPKYFYGTNNPAEDNYISPEELVKLYDFCFELCESLLELLDGYEKVILCNGANDFDDFVEEYCQLKIKYARLTC